MKNLQTLITMSTLMLSAQGTETATDVITCNDRQSILEDGTCSDCPAYTRAQNDNSYCNSD